MYDSRPSHPPFAMPHVSGIHGHLLEVTVTGCSNLRDTEWISKQDPYVTIEYGDIKRRTLTCTDGSKNPKFQEKFSFTLIEGLRVLIVNIYNSNSIFQDDLIGSGRVCLEKVLSTGYDDSSWPLETKSVRPAGKVHLIMHYPNATRSGHSCSPATPHPPLYQPIPPYPCVAPPPPQPPCCQPHLQNSGVYPQQYPFPASYTQQRPYPSVYPPILPHTDAYPSQLPASPYNPYPYPPPSPYYQASPYNF